MSSPEASIETMPLDQAAAILHAMLPDSSKKWRARIFSPDYILERARAMGTNVQGVRISQWEQLEDDELVKLLLKGVDMFGGEVVVVTDLCLGMTPPGVPSVSGAIRVNGLNFPDFVAAYRRELTDNFIDGDVVVASPSDRFIAVFHHEGVAAQVRLLG